MTIFLDGISARFYRGIGAETQFISPFSRVNFFIGTNNSGKSIILNMLSSQLSGLVYGKNIEPLKGPDVHKARQTGEFSLMIGVSEKSTTDYIVKRCQSDLATQQPHANRIFDLEIRNICKNLSKSGQIWIKLDATRGAMFHPKIEIDIAASWTTEWQNLWIAMTPFTGGGAPVDWINGVLDEIVKHSIPKIPPIYLIPSKRVLGSKGETFNDLSGRGLIDYLANLQNPKWDKQEDRVKFNRINRFLQEVTGKADAILEVPSEREHLLVHMDNKVLPLQSLGTGIHEVVLIAAFCTIHDKVIMCIEEPEIHLHPLLQRKLINYLIENTESQYFIATHSSVFIDTKNANIFHVSNDGEQTRVRAAVTRNEQRTLLDELGCQASDILQANSVIWVEGPSDRIYIKHWINALNKDLEEGIHYTIMFYGGGLISHLTASDSLIEGFIKLRDMNRHMAVVLDSDRDAENALLKGNAQRLVDEMDDGAGLVWVTAGREVENYVAGDKLQAVLKKLHPRLYKRAGNTGPFDHAFYFWRDETDPQKTNSEKLFKEANKVEAAALICQEPANLDLLDLRAQVGKLVAMICSANGLKAEK